MGFQFTSLQDFMANEGAYAKLGLYCADICTALGRGVDGKSLNDLSRSVCEAINQLTVWVEPEMYELDDLPMIHLSQNCLGYPAEGHQTMLYGVYKK